jgi:hypothetical protein
MVEAICFTIESSHCFSLQNSFFTRDFAKLGSKNKDVYVLLNFF